MRSLRAASRERLIVAMKTQHSQKQNKTKQKKPESHYLKRKDAEKKTRKEHFRKRAQQVHRS